MISTINHGLYLTKKSNCFGYSNFRKHFVFVMVELIYTHKLETPVKTQQHHIKSGNRHLDASSRTKLVQEEREFT